MPHDHIIYDADPHFTIDPKTRVITNNSAEKVTVMQGDHNSERFTFECERVLEGHDLADCNKVRVHYLVINPTTNEKYFGLYEVDDLHASETDETKVVCSWLLSKNVTQFESPLSFRLCFSCETEASIIYAWNTSIFSGINVGKGINSTETAEALYLDIMAVWKEELAKQQLVSLEQTETSEEEYGKNVITATYGDGRTEQFVVRNGGPGPKGDSSFSADVKDGVLVVEGFAALPSWEGGSY